MPLRLLPLPPVEFETYFRVAKSAFVPGYMEAVFPDGYSAGALQHNVASLRRNHARYPERNHLYKVVDSELPVDDEFGGVVGVSLWKIFPTASSEEEVKRSEEESERDKEEFGDAPGRKTDLADAFGNACSEYRKKHMGHEPCVLLQAIGTRAGYERRGIAGLSMEWGTKKADEMGLMAYLEASEKGVELYRRWGFQVLDQVPFNARDFGYAHPMTHYCMKRLPANHS